MSYTEDRERRDSTNFTCELCRECPSLGHHRTDGVSFQNPTSSNSYYRAKIERELVTDVDKNGDGTKECCFVRLVASNSTRPLFVSPPLFFIMARTKGATNKPGHNAGGDRRSGSAKQKLQEQRDPQKKRSNQENRQKLAAAASAPSSADSLKNKKTPDPYSPEMMAKSARRLNKRLHFSCQDRYGRQLNKC
jgi:hypothetical protein